MEYRHAVSRGDIKSEGDKYMSASRRQTNGVYTVEVVAPMNYVASLAPSAADTGTGVRVPLATSSFSGVGGGHSAVSPSPCGAASTCAGSETSARCSGPTNTSPFGVSATGSRGSSVTDVDTGTCDDNDGDVPFTFTGADVGGSPSAGSGVGERGTTTCLNPPGFSCSGGGDAGDEMGGAVVPRESMPLMRSFEKSEVRFVGAGTGARGTAPSGTLLGGNGSGGGRVGVVGRGETAALVARLSATSVSRRAVGAPAVFSTVNFSCRWRASVSKLQWGHS